MTYYADDIVVTAGSLEMLNEIVTQIEASTLLMKLKINVQKTKYMTNKERYPGQVDNRNLINGQYYEKVESFKYLGSFINSVNDAEEVIKPKF